MTCHQTRALCISNGVIGDQKASPELCIHDVNLRDFHIFEAVETLTCQANSLIRSVYNVVSTGLGSSLSG
jgi:hypothetical protein